MGRHPAADRSKAIGRTIARRMWRSSTRVSTQEILACSPCAIMSLASRAVGRPHRGKVGSSAGPGEPLLPVAAHVLEEQVAERDVGEAVARRRRQLLLPCAPRTLRSGRDAVWLRPGAAARPSVPVRRARRGGRHASPLDRTSRSRSSAVPPQLPDGSCEAGAEPRRCPCRSSTTAGSSFERVRMERARERFGGHRQSRAGNDQVVTGQQMHAPVLDGRDRRKR